MPISSPELEHSKHLSPEEAARVSVIDATFWAIVEAFNRQFADTETATHLSEAVGSSFQSSSEPNPIAFAEQAPENNPEKMAHAPGSIEDLSRQALDFATKGPERISDGATQ